MHNGKPLYVGFSEYQKWVPKEKSKQRQSELQNFLKLWNGELFQINGERSKRQAYDTGECPSLQINCNNEGAAHVQWYQLPVIVPITLFGWVCTMWKEIYEYLGSSSSGNKTFN